MSTVGFWADSPATTTPRNANNLSRSERYTLLTVNSTDAYKFYCSIDGGSNLSNGDIIKVEFPTITNTTVLQISITGENGTYYTTGIPAKELSNKFCEFVFNGTDFDILNYKSVLTAECNLSVSNTSTGSNVPDFKVVPIGSVLSVGRKFTLSSDKIYIGNGISAVNISAQGYFTTGISADDLARVVIVKNGTTIVSRSYVRVRGTYVMVACPAKCVSVEEGDYLELRFNNGTATGSNIGTGSGTYISCAEI